MSDSTTSQLHIIQQAIGKQTFEIQLARLVENNDYLLFLNDGLYTLFEPDILKILTLKDFQPTQLLIIDEQVDARGLQNKPINSDVSKIDYSQFVECAQQASKVISW